MVHYNSGVSLYFLDAVYQRIETLDFTIENVTN